MEPDTTEFLILPDGQILVHNLTPSMAAIVSALNPSDELMRQRAAAAQSIPPARSPSHDNLPGN